MKTIKSEFSGALESINFTLEEQSGGHAGGEVGLKGRGGAGNPTGLLATASPLPNPLPPAPFLLNMSETFAPLRLQEAQTKFP